MIVGSAPWRVFLAGAVLVLAGCATRRYEAPPEVIPQPPDITAAEAVSAERARRQRTRSRPGRRLQRAQRSRPTSRSTAEIRRQNAEAALSPGFPAAAGLTRMT